MSFHAVRITTIIGITTHTYYCVFCYVREFSYRPLYTFWVTNVNKMYAPRCTTASLCFGWVCMHQYEPKLNWNPDEGVQSSDLQVLKETEHLHALYSFLDYPKKKKKSCQNFRLSFKTLKHIWMSMEPLITKTEL